MAMVGLYRGILPSPPAIDFTSSEGKQLFVEAVQNRTMEGFYKLISNFQTQSELTYCGLASLSMALNALSIDPGRKWKGPWRWFEESMLDYCECEPLEKVKARGISLGKLASLAHCAGAHVQAFRSNQTTIHDFRKYLLRCSTFDDCHIILSYHRVGLKQTGAGHYSPVGGYHTGRDMVLILDVARFKYPPHWVPLKLLWEAMERVIEATGQYRGFFLLSKPQYNTMAMVGFYRRILPSPPAIDFTSSEGKQLFVEAVQNRTMEGFYKLISNFQTQSELTYCGLASLSMALNALSIDPGRKWKGPWRWFDESMLDYCECEPLEKVKARGISLGKLASLAHCAGAQVEAFCTNQTTIHDFRKYLLRCSTSDDCHIILSYHRTGLKQTGAGHYSPVGGYHIGRDMVLILDVARFKYPPHWVPLKLIWEAMERVIEATGQHRGFMLLSRH